MPNFEIRCKNCGFKQELLLTQEERDRFDDIVEMLPCEECANHGRVTCDWIKLPTTANIPKSGRYSFEDK